MTDDLKTLLRREAEDLRVPGVPAYDVIASGRRVRRRSAWTKRAGASALAVALAGGVVALRDGSSSEPGPADGNTSSTIAYGDDNTVYFGDGTHVTLDEYAQSVFYTSAGILVRTNADGSNDGGSPYHYELIRSDGSMSSLDLNLGYAEAGVDPDQPYLAWATMTSGSIQIHVRDLRTDQEVATVDVPGTYSWAGWNAPPVALSGDFVYVGTDHHAEVVNWRTGESHTSGVLPGSHYPEVHGGRVVETRDHTVRVLDARSGNVLLEVPVSKHAFPQISPDGRFLVVNSGPGWIFRCHGDGSAPDDCTRHAIPGAHAEAYDVASGAKVRLPAAGWGWSRHSDHVFRVLRTTMTSCSTSTGQCRRTAVPAVDPHRAVSYPGFANSA